MKQKSFWFFFFRKRTKIFFCFRNIGKTPPHQTASTSTPARVRVTFPHMIPIQLIGEQLLLDPAGVLFWPGASLLAVADLHLEKGSASARQGNLVPPWDSRVIHALHLGLRQSRPMCAGRGGRRE
jgi:hypothetical protein